MKYQIDLNKMCRSIESNNSLEAIEYIDEHIRTVEWKMKAEEFESRKDEIKKALEKLYDGTKEGVDEAIKITVKKYYDKIKKKNPEFKYEDAVKWVSESIKMLDKNKFVEDLLVFITDRTPDENGKKRKGIPIASFDNEKFKKLSGSVSLKQKLNFGIGIVTGAFLSALILATFPTLAKYSLFIASGLTGLSITQLNSSIIQKQVRDNIDIYSDLSVTKDIRKLFSLKWDYNRSWNNKYKGFVKGKGESKLLVIPKFKIKTINKKDEKNELISN